MQNIIVFGLIRSLHDLFTAFWIGGMAASAFALMPALRNKDKDPSKASNFQVKYQEKLSVLALISILVLWITGLLLGRQSGGLTGLFSFSTTYQTLLSIKHLIILVMVAIAIYRRFGLGRKIETFTPSNRKLYGVLLLINTLLGIVVIFLSGFSSVIH